jgi:hypothetical protein
LTLVESIVSFVYVSTDDQLDDEDFGVGYSRIWRFQVGAAEHYEATSEFRWPKEYVGNAFLILAVNHGSQSAEETDRSNNQLVIPVESTSDLDLLVADLRSPIMVRSAPGSSVKQNDEGIIEDAPLINNASGSTKLVADAVDEGSLTRVDAAKREKRLNRDQTETDTGGLSESHLDHWMATIGRTGL